MFYIKGPNLKRLSRHIKHVAMLPFVIAVMTNCSSNSSSGTSNNASNNKASSSSSSASSEQEKSNPFTLQFKAMVGDLELNCDDTYGNLGPNEEYSIGITDLRFYVSNVQFYNSAGDTIGVDLDNNDYQLNHQDGAVALIDFSGTESGFCANASKGTPRTNTVISGRSADVDIAAVSFDVGVPQATMKTVIASTSVVTDVPSPLAEMHWSWAGGYKFFEMNFSLMSATQTDMVENSGIHIGSKDCGGAGKALSDRETCGLLNTPKVMLSDFDPEVNSVVVDLAQVFNAAPAEAFGAEETLGMQCHSAVAAPGCAATFPNFGIDLANGQSDAQNNIVFGKQ